MKGTAYVWIFVFAACVTVVCTQNATQDNTSTTTTSTSTFKSTTLTTTTTTIVPSESTTLVPATPAVLAPVWKLPGGNETCILMSGNLSFLITYETANGQTSNGKIDIPDTAKVSGMCSPYVATLVLTWDTSSTPSAPKQQNMVNNVTFLFTKAGYEGSSGPTSYSLVTVFGSLTADLTAFPDAKMPGKSYYISAKLADGDLVNVPLNKSYTCQSYKTIAADTTGNIQLQMSAVQLEAFHMGNNDEFGEGSVCAKDTALAVLPILAYTLIPLIILAALGTFVWRHFRRPGYSQV